MGTLIVIYGLPGTGKTTISKKIKEKFRDKCERLYTRHYEGDFKNDRDSKEYFEAKEHAYNNLFDRAKDSMKTIPLVVVEGTFTDIGGGTTGQERLESYITLAEEENYQPLLLGISCSDEKTTANRLIERKKLNPKSRGSLKEYRILIPAFNINLTHPNNIEIDNNASLKELNEILEKEVYHRIYLNGDAIPSIDCELSTEMIARKMYRTMKG